MNALSSVPSPSAARPTVVVVDRFPALSAGLAAILTEAGFDVKLPGRAQAWALRRGPDAVFVTVDPTTDGHESMRALLCGYRDAVVIAVLVSDENTDPVPILRCGAHAVVGRSAEPSVISTTTRSALAGLTVLPTPVVHRLVRPSPRAADGTPGCELSADDIRWLQTLARGQSVVQLARKEGYSEREVFRRLASLYRRMGAANRHEAIALASARGILADLAS